MEKIKVVEYTERWTVGGIESYIVNLIRNIDHEKFEIKIIVAQKETEIYDLELRQYDCKIEELLDKVYDNPIKRVVTNQRAFNKYISNNKCEVLHLHICQGVALKYAKYAKQAGIKKIISHCHNTEVGNRNRIIKLVGHNLGKKFYGHYTNKKIACSDLAAKWLYSPKKLKNVSICPYIVDVDKFKFSENDRVDMRNKFRLQNRTVYLHIGRMHPQKNQFFLLDVCKDIFEMDSKAVLVFIGTGELEKEIREHANKINIIDKIIFVDKTRDINKFMSMSDAFLLPSQYEGNPIVGIEAQASGLPCFFSDTITQQAKILECVNFYSLKNPNAVWAEKIVEYLKNNLLVERSKAVNEMKKAGYNVLQQVKEIENLYNI